MEVVKGANEWANWWIIVMPSAKVLDYIRRSIPVSHRSFSPETQTWRVHDKYIEDVKQLAARTLTGLPFIASDPYAVLHLRPTAPQAIIKAVWKEMVKELHPDRGGDPEEFKRVKEAYEKLTKV